MKNILKQSRSLLLTVIIFVFVTSAFIEGSIVPTPSMEKTILVGDRLFINKFVFGASTPSYIPFTNIELPHYRFPALREPKRNEIIVFRFPGDQFQLKDDAVEFWVKRCLALPGDTIEIKNKVVFVNSKRSPIPANILYQTMQIKNEGMKNNRIFPQSQKWNEDNYGPLVIPKKGDKIILTKGNINDWKTIIDREFDREVVTIEDGNILIDGEKSNEYILKQDYYFMVGDNRDDSYDSRFWGFVPRENIVGTPIIIFWSWDSNIPFTKPFELFSSVRVNRIMKLVE
ncbi:MAG: signal peptidase I [Ignavibacteriales bacterium]|nr:signal peptidase I [Ignavibacteriales bacterium]MCB9257771.1 signal peptidase I [Ignavibacteriales bacterium]